jgi:DNA-binding NtrC family response regulator
VREIRNAADRFVLEASDGRESGTPEPLRSPTLAQQVDQVEKALLEHALRRNAGRVQAVMDALGTPKKTLYDKLHRHGIDPDRYR